MSIGIFVWSLMCFAAGFAAYPYVQRFAWYRALAKRVTEWADGDK